jgi:hypothetical protein
MEAIAPIVPSLTEIAAARLSRGPKPDADATRRIDAVAEAERIARMVAV